MVEGEVAQAAEWLFPARRELVELPSENFVRPDVKREVGIALGDPLDEAGFHFA